MSDERFFERLRGDARTLRYEPDDMSASRVAARVRSRIAATPPTVAQLLAAWARPLAVSLAALALAATISLTWIDRQDTLAASPTIDSVTVSMDGELYSVSE